MGVLTGNSLIWGAYREPLMLCVCVGGRTRGLQPTHSCSHLHTGTQPFPEDERWGPGLVPTEMALLPLSSLVNSEKRSVYTCLDVPEWRALAPLLSVQISPCQQAETVLTSCFFLPVFPVLQ